MKAPKNILVVEDEILIANHIRRILEKNFYTCSGIAINYGKAIEILDKNETDAVILDVNISGERSGIDVGHTIQDKYNLPFVYLTSYSDESTLSSIIESKPRAYLVKPLVEAALVTTLNLIFSSDFQNKQLPFVFDSGNTTYKIDPEDVYYIQSSGNYVELHSISGKKLIRSSLSNMINCFPVNCITRISRTQAINLRFVNEMKGSLLITGFGKSFNISTNYLAEVRNILQSII